MKKSLLLTTALVAFATPSWAITGSSVMGKEVTKTDYTITVNEPTNNAIVAWIVGDNGVLNLDGTTSITTTASSGTNRGLSVQSNKSAGTTATVNIKGESASFSLTNGLAQALFSTGDGSLINVTADSLDIDVTSNSYIAYGLSAQMGGTITTAENTTTTIDTTSTASDGYAIGVYLNEAKDGSGTPDADIDGGNITLNGATTITADGQYAYGVLAEKIATNSETKGSNFTASDISVTATATELAYGIRVESNTTATIGKANLIAEAGGQAIGLDVRSGSDATLSDNAIISATSTSGIAYGVFAWNGDVEFTGDADISTESDGNSRAVWGYDNAEILFNGNNATLSSSGDGAMTLAADGNSSITFNSDAVISASDDNAHDDYSTTTVAATGNGSIEFNGASTNISVDAENSYASAVYTDDQGIINFNSDTTNIVAVGREAYGIETYADSTVNINGNATVSGSTSDIYNDGTLNVAGSLTLDNGITGTGAVEFKEGSKLTVKANKTAISNTVTNKGATLSMIFDAGFEGEYDLITEKGSLDKEFTIAENGIYKIEAKDLGLYTISKKSSSEVAESLGATTTEANALLAAISNTNSSNQAFNDVASALSTAAQQGEASAASEASKLGASDSPIVPSQETAMQNALFGVVAGELNGATGAIAQGKSSGDYLKKATAWIRGLFNKADHENTNKASGFTSDTYGVAMGIDQEVGSDTRLGFGYANSQTDIDSSGRKTDVDTNTLFVYSKYKPADWYINSMLAYSWSEYDEKKSVLGADASAKYDVDTLALHAMYGYETYYKCYDITPEFGLRYMHIEQDAYTNKLGSRVAKNSDDVLTVVAGVKVARNYRLNNGTTLRPEFNAAVTYDLFDADNSANVLLANNAAYRVNGEKLNRLGFEIGGKLTNNVTDKVEVSAGYFTRVREDYQDHTLMFDAKYNF